MSKDRISMPSSGAGITRYFEDYKSKLGFKPGVVIIFTLIVIVLVLFLQAYGNKLIGLN
jgi:preprotein translocase subunit Sec61beta